ncbi:MAG: hypothetical protein AAFY72_03415, partial [Cyanobacteria bacterium J06649_4]
GDRIREITSHKESIFSLAFSPDGQQLASGGEAGVIHLSDVETGQHIIQLNVDSPYKGLDVSKVTGLTKLQRETLLSLGATD